MHRRFLVTHNYEPSQSSGDYSSSGPTFPKWSQRRRNPSTRNHTVAQRSLENAENGTNLANLWHSKLKPTLPYHLQWLTTHRWLRIIQGWSLQRQQIQLQGWKHKLQGCIGHPYIWTPIRMTTLNPLPDVHICINLNRIQCMLNLLHDARVNKRLTYSPLCKHQYDVTRDNFPLTGPNLYLMKKWYSPSNTYNFGKIPIIKKIGISCTPTNLANCAKF